MLDVILLVGLGSLLAVGLVTLWLVRPQLYIVDEEERLVIYRFGQFKSFDGPGRVWIMRRIERVARTIVVREQPHQMRIEGLYAYDIPLGYTLNIWYKLDPEIATGGDRHRLRKLAQFDNVECEENIRTRIHDLFVYHISEYLRTSQLPKSATVLEKLVPFAPGQTGCEQIIARIQEKLPDILRSFGAVLCQTQPLTIQKFHLTPSIIKLLDRERVLASLQYRMPNSDQDMLAQAAIALEGISLPSILRKIVVDQPDSTSMPLHSLIDDDLVLDPFEKVRSERHQGTAPLQPKPVPPPLASHRNIPLERQAMLSQ